jgi:signal transduction histidine kinase
VAALIGLGPSSARATATPVGPVARHSPPAALLLTFTLVIGQSAVIFVLMRKLRRRRAAKQAAVAAQTRAEIASRAKTEFIAAISDDLRGPLNTVIGFADVMIADRVGALGPGKRMEYLSAIRENGLRALERVGNTLDLARIEMDELEISDADINLAQTLSLCARLVADQAAAANIRLDLSLPDYCPHLRGDAQRVKQSVINLLSNAIRFSGGNEDRGEGGVVRLAATVSDDGRLIVSVSDNGPGFPLETIAPTLDPIHHGSWQRGAGLGLPLTANLMRHHGGALVIHNANEGQNAAAHGTTATLVFPANRVIPPLPERHPAQPRI